MGYIKEPKGIDFVINSGSLTDSDREEISRFIKDYKLNSKTNGSQKQMRMSKTNVFSENYYQT